MHCVYVIALLCGTINKNTMNFLKNHTSKETAFEIVNYPYGRLRTSMFVWIETTPKKGDRVCRQTIDPKSGRLNAVKCSTYSNLMFMCLDEKNHVQTTGASIYSKKDQVEALVNSFGVENLNPEQLKQFKQLMGEVLVKVDEFTGQAKKDFSVKWERDIIGAGWKNGKYNKGEKGDYTEAKITFDRPDGISKLEIFKAIKTLNQESLKQVFQTRESRTFGSYEGFVRICVRGGFQLCTVSKDAYYNFLASDLNQEFALQ